MEQLLKYFMDETNKKIDELSQEQKRTNDKLEDLQSFKVSMVVSARWVSLIVSSACGLVTMLVTLWVSGKLGH